MVTSITTHYFFNSPLTYDELKNCLDASSLISITDPNGIISYANENFCKLSKYSQEELLGKDHKILNSRYHSKAFFKNMWNTITSGKVWYGNIKNKAKDGSFYWVKTTITPILDNDKNIVKFISTRIDITREQNLMRKLEDSNAQLLKKELELKRQMKETFQRFTLEKQLHESKAQLKAEKSFTHQKDEFAAMISHELKTPLFPIKMHCEMLKNPNMMGTLTSEQLESVNEIEKMTNILSELTNDIFDVHKLNVNQMTFNKKYFNLSHLENHIRHEIDPFTNEKQILFTTSFENTEIFSDYSRLSQVLVNLIVNSVDFVPTQSGIIHVSAFTHDENILFSVVDNGIGIEEKMIPHIFRKFYQVDTSLERKHGGSGLGLVICKGIVESLGGKIWVESKVKHGTTFYFTIPKLESSDYLSGPRNPLLYNDNM